MLMTVFVAVKIEAEQLRSVPRSFSFHWSNAPRHVVSFNGFRCSCLFCYRDTQQQEVGLSNETTSVKYRFKGKERAAR